MLPYSSLTGRRVLVAEDNLINIEVLRQYLDFLKIKSHFVTDGKQCIAELQNDIYDCVLMDIQMPEMDGLAAIQQLRHDPNCGNIPIIALTALAMAGDRERCLDAGANDYLSKPVRLKDLASTIHQLLSGSS